MTAPERQSRSERAYRRLLRLLPRDFLSEFGDSMAGDFRDRDRELSGRARRRLWSREFPAMMRTAIAQHVASIWRDVRFALRMMARSPGFTAAALFMLALGTGANAAMFSVIDAVIFRSAFRDAGRVVSIEEQIPGKPPSWAVPLSHLDMLATAPVFEGVAGVTGSLPVMANAGPPRRIDVECVSSSMFGLLGVPPAIGRVLVPDDDRVGAAPVIVLSHRTWIQDFNGAPDIVGRTITLDGHANTVVGVMPDGFLGPFVSNKIEAWAALMPATGQQSAAGCLLHRRSDDPTTIADKIDVIGRVRPRFTLDTAAAQLDAMGLAARLPTPPGGIQPTRIVLERADDVQLARVRAPFLALLGAVGCVLLIACANVANLQLERLIGRRREIAIRLAIGATPGRIVRQTLVENLLVSLLGAGLGVLTARLTLQTIVGMIPLYVPHVHEIEINGRTLVATFAGAVVAGVVVGLVPALQAARANVTGDLSQSSGRVIGGAQWIRRGLVVSEVALSVVLLIAAVLMLRTFLILRPVTPGFDATNRIVADVLLAGPWKADPERERFVNGVMDGISRIPGVRSVSATSYLPLSGVTDLANIRVGEVSADVWSSWVTPQYFHDLAIVLTRGRMFEASDNAGGPPVAMINEALAARFWPGADPVGQRIDVVAPDKTMTPRQIVGVLHTTRSWGTDREERSEVYVPYTQEPGSTLIYFIVSTTPTPPVDLASQITSTVTALRPNTVVDRIEPLQASLDRSIAQPRFAASLFGAFAVMAVGLAGLGLTAVITWWVAQRRREIGVRVALGADARKVSVLVLRQALWLTITGVLVGVVVAAMVTRAIGAWLYGVAPLDPLTFAGAAVGMTAIAAAAAYFPARRASRIDPIITLRSE